MPADVPSGGARRTVALVTILHAFTHGYQVLLVPLYLLMVADLGLPGVSHATFIVTIYGLTYFGLSYAAGVLADRFDRKWLLGLGIILNGLAIGLMGTTPRYEMLVVLGILAGFAGTLYHPSANSLVAAHFPKAPGSAIGIVAIGAAVGFFAGPQFAGWRAGTEWGHWLPVSDWQLPCVEAGLAGVIFGLVFLTIAREPRSKRPRVVHAGPSVPHPPLGRSLRWRVGAIAGVLGLRDFAGVGVMTLASIYLQMAMGLDVKQTGFILGAMTLVSIAVNPLAVWISPGRRRLFLLAGCLVGGGLVVSTLPLWPLAFVLPVLCLFQAFMLSTHALSDAAVLERVAPEVRGRAVGLFLTIAGTMGSASPWFVGAWTDRLRDASDPADYVIPFAALGLVMVLSSLSVPLIARLDRPTDTTPAGRALAVAADPAV